MKTQIVLILTLILFAPVTSSAFDKDAAKVRCWKIMERMATGDVKFSFFDPLRVQSTSVGFHVEGNAKFQNGFGAWMKHRVYCYFDRQGKVLGAGLRN